MSQQYTQFDWATDRLARTTWADEEERLMDGIDRRANRQKIRKNNRKNHRNYV